MAGPRGTLGGPWSEIEDDGLYEEDDSDDFIPLESFSEGPSEPLGFEINPIDTSWTFAPNYYPSELTQNGSNELKRDGGNCGNQDVSVKKNKNREIHIRGIVLEERLGQLHALMDFTNELDLISPLTPNNAGMECYMKKCEIGEKQGWHEDYEQYLFDYTIDLVSSGRDGFTNDRNSIVTSIMDDN